jgi:ribose transport system substrate-binding protein
MVRLPLRGGRVSDEVRAAGGLRSRVRRTVGGEMLHAKAKGIYSATVAVATTAGLVAYGASSGSSAAKQLTGGAASAHPIHVLTYVNPLPPYLAFNQVGACFRREAKKLGYTAHVVGTPGNAVDNQAALNLINQSIADGTDGVFAFLTIPKLFEPVIKQARSKGIYFGGLDSGMKGTGQQFLAGTDWLEGGKVLADAVGKKYPDAQVGFLSSSPDSSAQADAVKGFEQEAKNRFPHMKMVAIVYDNGDPTQDTSLVSNMLAAHPNINLLNLVPGNTAGGIAAVQERGLTNHVKIVSGDLTPDHRAALKNGTLWGVTSQDWCDQGKYAVEAFHDLSLGKKIKFSWNTSVTFVTKADMPKTGY